MSELKINWYIRSDRNWRKNADEYFFNRILRRTSRDMWKPEELHAKLKEPSEDLAESMEEANICVRCFSIFSVFSFLWLRNVCLLSTGKNGVDENQTGDVRSPYSSSNCCAINPPGRRHLSSGQEASRPRNETVIAECPNCRKMVESDEEFAKFNTHIDECLNRSLLQSENRESPSETAAVPPAKRKLRLDDVSTNRTSTKPKLKEKCKVSKKITDYLKLC